METMRKVAVLLCILAPAGWACAQSGQVKFRGIVTKDEAHDVLPICYGDYHVSVDIDMVVEDPAGALTGLDSVQVCYGTAQGLVRGDPVEVYGYYWGGGMCPKQYCGRVQIVEKSDYIRRIPSYGDNDWMVCGDLMYSIPSGNVGIGTSEPAEKLHVLGNVLIEAKASEAAAAPAVDEALKPALRVVKQGSGRQLAAYFLNPADGAAEVEVQLAGGSLLPWGWSLKAAGGMLTLGSVMTLPPALNVKSTGYVGIGDTSPEYRLELPNTAGAAGRGRANAWVTYSSQRWKTNIRTIDGAMDKVRNLRGVYFDWKDGGVHDMGMVAEEVGRVIPEVVDYEANGTAAESLAYGRLVALLVEALKEQDARIAELEQLAARNQELERRLDTLERLVRQQAQPIGP